VIPQSLTLRSVAIARVFATQPELQRDENLRFYDSVTGQGVDLPELVQSARQVQLLKRAPGQPAGAFQVLIDHLGSQLRFLVSEDYPPRPFALFAKDADATWDAFLGVWPLNRLGGRPILSEVTLRMTAASESGSATTFLVDRVLHLSTDSLARLGRAVLGVGLRVIVPLQVGSRDEKLPLNGADINLLVETLVDDPSRLYFEITAKWPALPLPPEIVAQGGPSFLNAEVRKPSEYLEDVYSYLTDRVVTFLRPS
jgi:hypothetical protein